MGTTKKSDIKVKSKLNTPVIAFPPAITISVLFLGELHVNWGLAFSCKIVGWDDTGCNNLNFEVFCIKITISLLVEHNLKNLNV